MFIHEKTRNGGNVTSPFISELKIGLWPSPTAPQFNKSKHGFINKMAHEFCKKQATKALKCFECNQPGHLRVDCPIFKKKMEKFEKKNINEKKLILAKL